MNGSRRKPVAEGAPIHRTGGWRALGGRLAEMASLAITAPSRDAETEMLLRRTCTGCCAA